MLATVTAVDRFTQYNGSISPTPLDNTSTFSTWQPDTEANITRPHKCLQVLYEDIGDSRYIILEDLALKSLYDSARNTKSK